MNLNMVHTALVLKDSVCLASPGTHKCSLAERRSSCVTGTLDFVLGAPVNVGFRSL